MPTALVTGSPERVSDIAVALKSHGFDILATGSETPEGATDPDTVDCYVQLSGGANPPDDHTLTRARAVIAGLAPKATVVLVADGRGEDGPTPDLQALRTLVGLLAKAIIWDQGPVRARVVDDSWVPAPRAESRPPDVTAWRSYLDLEPELGHADWREEVMAASSAV